MYKDLDIDFADRQSIINYLSGKYGEDHVCQILNISYITPNVSIKDVGRVLGIPYNITDKIAKKFVYETFEECMSVNSEIVSQMSEYNELFHIASKISGRVRNVSMHAGGVVVYDDNVTNHAAMKLGANGEHVIQVDKKVIERIGGIKFDILGVRTLKVVQDAMNMAGLCAYDVSINNPAFANDNEMYKILCEAKTNGVFQTESQGMKDLLVRLQPSSLEDVSAVLALYRPDSMPMLEEFIDNKIHHKRPTYIHDDMGEILDRTYGALIYQEQLMDIVRKFGGRSYGGADKFRKGIGKKDKALIKAESEKLYQEIIDNGYEESVARQISDTLSEKGGYLFNHSHSALYSILTLKTAYLKAHYPAEFFCALLNQNLNDFGAINKYILEARDFNIEVLHPHINRSQREFSIYDGKILFGLSAIKGIGSSVVDAIMLEHENGKFTNLSDLLSRVKLTTAQVVALIKAGAIPAKDKRNALLKYCEMILPEASEYKPVNTLPTKAKLLIDYGIDAGIVTDKDERLRLLNVIKRRQHEDKQAEKLSNARKGFIAKYMSDEQFWEFETLSVFISNNPFEKAARHLTTSFSSISDGDKCTIVGVISSVQKKKDKNKNQFCFVNINSLDGFLELTAWSSQYKLYSEFLVSGSQVAVLAKKSDDKAVIEQVKPYSQWLEDRGIK